MKVLDVEGCGSVTNELLDACSVGTDCYHMQGCDREGCQHQFLVNEETATLVHTTYAERKRPNVTFVDVVQNIHTLDLTSLVVLTTARSTTEQQIRVHKQAYGAKQRDKAVCEQLEAQGIDPESDQGKDVRAKYAGQATNLGGSIGAILSREQMN